MPEHLAIFVQNTVTAFSTGGQANAVAITSTFVRVSTCAAHLDSIKLQTTILQPITVRNDGAYDCAVFPPSGGQIDALGANIGYTLASGSVQTFIPTSATQWYTQNKALRRVDRGNVAAGDFNTGNVTDDGAAYDLDLTSIIPPSAYGKPIEASMYVKGSAATRSGSIYSKDNTNGVNRLRVLGDATDGQECSGTVVCDSAGKCTYIFSGECTTINLIINGWWVEG